MEVCEVVHAREELDQGLAGVAEGCGSGATAASIFAEVHGEENRVLRQSCSVYLVVATGFSWRFNDSHCRRL